MSRQYVRDGEGLLVYKNKNEKKKNSSRFPLSFYSDHRFLRQTSIVLLLKHLNLMVEGLSTKKEIVL